MIPIPRVHCISKLLPYIQCSKLWFSDVYLHIEQSEMSGAFVEICWDEKSNQEATELSAHGKAHYTVL